MYIEGYSESKILVVRPADGRVIDVLDPSSDEYSAKKSKYRMQVKADALRLYCSCKYKRGENNEHIRYTIYENGSLQPLHKGNGIYHRPSCSHNNIFQSLYEFNAGFKVTIDNKKKSVVATIAKNLDEPNITLRVADQKRLSAGAITPAAFFWLLLAEQYEQYAFTTNNKYAGDKTTDKFLSYLKGSLKDTVVNDEKVFDNASVEADIKILQQVEQETTDGYTTIYFTDYSLPGRERAKIRVKQNMFYEAVSRFERGMDSIEYAMERHGITIAVCYIREDLPKDWKISGKQYTHLSLIALAKNGMPVESVSEFYAAAVLNRYLSRGQLRLYKPWQQAQSPFRDETGMNYLPCMAIGTEKQVAYYINLQYKNNKQLPLAIENVKSPVPIITWDTRDHINIFKETVQQIIGEKREKWTEK